MYVIWAFSLLSTTKFAPFLAATCTDSERLKKEKKRKKTVAWDRTVFLALHETETFRRRERKCISCLFATEVLFPYVQYADTTFLSLGWLSPLPGNTRTRRGSYTPLSLLQQWRTLKDKKKKEKNKEKKCSLCVYLKRKRKASVKVN